MPKTVWRWLERYPYDATNYTRNIAGIHKAVSFPWIQDGLRHTFATYMCAHKGFVRAAKCTGHKNPYTLANHYVGVATKAQGKSFFKLRPGAGPQNA